MPTYLYCLLAASSDARPDVPPSLTGVGGGRVRALEAGGMLAWVETVDSSVLPRTVETARAHDRVVRAAMELGDTPLPARSGQLFADDAVCAEELRRREREIARGLREIEGCVEMIVHVAIDARRGGGRAGEAAPRLESFARPGTPGGTAPGRGRAYLEELRERLQLEHSVQSESANLRTAIRTAVEGLARDESFSIRPGTTPRLTISHLISRTDIARYRTVLADARATRGLEIVQVAGPYPPYSFAGLSNG